MGLLRGVATSLVDGSLGGVEQMLKQRAPELRDLSRRLEEDVEVLPEKVLEALKRQPVFHRRAKDTLDEAAATAQEVHERLDAFHQRVGEALATATRLNRMILQQRDADGAQPKLPEDSLEYAGACLAHLNRAQKLSGLLKREASDFLHIAQEQKLRYAGFALDPAVLVHLGEGPPSGIGRAQQHRCFV